MQDNIDIVINAEPIHVSVVPPPVQGIDIVTNKGSVYSVNGKTATVILTASDIGADPEGSADAALDAAKVYTDSEIEGLTYSDVGADPAGAASSALTDANSYTDGQVTALTTSFNAAIAFKSTISSPVFTGTVTLPTGGVGAVPLLMVSSALKTAPVAGGIEFLTDKAYFTISTGTARKEFTFNDAALTAGRIPFVTTNGRLTDSANITYDGTTILHTNTAGGRTAIREWVTVGAAYGAIYLGAVTPAAANYALVGFGSVTRVNGTSQVKLDANGVEVFTVSAGSCIASQTLYAGARLRVGDAVTAPTALVHIKASTTALGHIKFDAGVAPTGGALTDGVFWFDGTDVKIRVGGVTKTFTLT